MEMKLRKGRNTDHRFQVQISVKMPVDVAEHPPHQGMVV